jgi:elongation factor P
MVHAPDLKAGMVLRLEKNLYKILHFEYHTGGGKMGSLVHVKLKDLKTGAFLDRNFKPEERMELAELGRKIMDYLYKDADGYYLMDPESNEQIQLDKHHLEPFDPFLQPNMKLTVEFLGEDPIHVVFPESVELRVTSTPPGLGKPPGRSDQARHPLQWPPDPGPSVHQGRRSGEGERGHEKKWKE